MSSSLPPGPAFQPQNLQQSQPHDLSHHQQHHQQQPQQAKESGKEHQGQKAFGHQHHIPQHGSIEPASPRFHKASASVATTNIAAVFAPSKTSSGNAPSSPASPSVGSSITSPFKHHHSFSFSHAHPLPTASFLPQPTPFSTSSTSSTASPAFSAASSALPTPRTASSTFAHGPSRRSSQAANAHATQHQHSKSATTQSSRGHASPTTSISGPITALPVASRYRPRPRPSSSTQSIGNTSSSANPSANVQSPKGTAPTSPRVSSTLADHLHTFTFPSSALSKEKTDAQTPASPPPPPPPPPVTLDPFRHTRPSDLAILPSTEQPPVLDSPSLVSPHSFLPDPSSEQPPPRNRPSEVKSSRNQVPSQNHSRTSDQPSLQDPTQYQSPTSGAPSSSSRPPIASPRPWKNVSPVSNRPPSSSSHHPSILFSHRNSSSTSHIAAAPFSPRLRPPTTLETSAFSPIASPTAEVAVDTQTTSLEPVPLLQRRPATPKRPLSFPLERKQSVDLLAPTNPLSPTHFLSPPAGSRATGHTTGLKQPVRRATPSSHNNTHSSHHTTLSQLDNALSQAHGNGVSQSPSNQNQEDQGQIRQGLNQSSDQNQNRSSGPPLAQTSSSSLPTAVESPTIATIANTSSTTIASAPHTLTISQPESSSPTVLVAPKRQSMHKSTTEWAQNQRELLLPKQVLAAEAAATDSIDERIHNHLYKRQSDHQHHDNHSEQNQIGLEQKTLEQKMLEQKILEQKAQEQKAQKHRQERLQRRSEQKFGESKASRPSEYRFSDSGLDQRSEKADHRTFHGLGLASPRGSSERMSMSRPPVSYKSPITSPTSPSGPVKVPPIRNFRSSGSRRSLPLDSKRNSSDSVPRNPSGFTTSPEEVDMNQRERALQALEGRLHRDLPGQQRHSYHSHTSVPDYDQPLPSIEDSSSSGPELSQDDTADLFLSMDHDESSSDEEEPSSMDGREHDSRPDRERNNRFSESNTHPFPTRRSYASPPPPALRSSNSSACPNLLPYARHRRSSTSPFPASSAEPNHNMSLYGGGGGDDEGGEDESSSRHYPPGTTRICPSSRRPISTILSHATSTLASSPQLPLHRPIDEVLSSRTMDAVTSTHAPSSSSTRPFSDQETGARLATLNTDVSHGSRPYQHPPVSYRSSIVRDLSRSGEDMYGRRHSAVRPSPTTPRAPSSLQQTYHDVTTPSAAAATGTGLATPAYRRKGSVSDGLSSTGSDPLLKSMAARAYGSPAIATHGLSEMHRHGGESTESNSSTTGQSTVWDDLDELKSRIQKLERTGKLPKGTLSRISDDRPATANTAFTTISSSPRPHPGKSLPRNPISEARASTRPVDGEEEDDAEDESQEDDRGAEGTKENGAPTRDTHSLLQSAISNTRGMVSEEVYRALEASVMDALTLSSLVGTVGHPGSFPSALSGSSSTSGPFHTTSVTERQVRRKVESLCRSLTELCLAFHESGDVSGGDARVERAASVYPVSPVVHMPSSSYPHPTPPSARSTIAPLATRFSSVPRDLGPQQTLSQDPQTPIMKTQAHANFGGYTGMRTPAYVAANPNPAFATAAAPASNPGDAFMSPRAMSKLEQRRNDLLHSSMFTPRVSLSNPASPADTSHLRRSSLMVNRRRVVAGNGGGSGVEEGGGAAHGVAEGRQSSLLRTRRAGTEEAEEAASSGRRSSMFLRTMRNTHQPSGSSPMVNVDGGPPMENHGMMMVDRSYRSPSRAIGDVGMKRISREFSPALERNGVVVGSHTFGGYLHPPSEAKKNLSNSSSSSLHSTGGRAMMSSTSTSSMNNNHATTTLYPSPTVNGSFDRSASTGNDGSMSGTSGNSVNNNNNNCNSPGRGEGRRRRLVPTSISSRLSAGNTQPPQSPSSSPGVVAGRRFMTRSEDRPPTGLTYSPGSAVEGGKLMSLRTGSVVGMSTGLGLSHGLGNGGTSTSSPTMPKGTMPQSGRLTNLRQER